MGTYSETGEGYCESCSGYDITLMKGATSAAQCIAIEANLDNAISVIVPLLAQLESNPCEALRGLEEMLEDCDGGKYCRRKCIKWKTSQMEQVIRLFINLKAGKLSVFIILQ